jgi:hypothetical protein
MLKTGVVALAAAAAMAAATPSQAASYLSVNAASACGTGGCFPGSTHTFTQAFSASGFHGTVDISNLMLDRSVLGALQDHVFKVSFRLADGTSLGDWGSFMIGVLGGQVVSLGGNAIAWDTSRGDLLMQLDVVMPDHAGMGGGGGGLFAPLAGRANSGFAGGFGGSGMLAQGSGGGAADVLLSAGRNSDLAEAIVRPSLAVPEPTSWALMILGFGAAGALLRRRQLRYA